MYRTLIISALFGLFGSSTLAQSSSESLEFNNKLKAIAERIASHPVGGSAYSNLYLIMYDACETALQNGVTKTRPSEAWRGAYCSCDSLLTFDAWLNDADKSAELRSFALFATEESAQTILASHYVFSNDQVCRKAVELDSSNAQP